MNIHCYNHYLHSAGVCATWLAKVGKVAGPNVALTPVCVGRCVLIALPSRSVALPNSQRHGHTLPRCLVSCIHHLPLFFSASWRYWSSIFEYIQKKSRTCAHILAAAKPSLRSLVLSLSLSPFALSSLSSVPSQSLHVLCPFASLSDHFFFFFTCFRNFCECDWELFDQFGLPTLSCSGHVEKEERKKERRKSDCFDQCKCVIIVSNQ